MGFGPEAAFYDGTAFSADNGGIVLDDGQKYSVADVSMVPNGQPAQRTEDGWEVQAHRTGRVSILEGDQSLPTTYGAELEYIEHNPDGSYARRDEEELLRDKELFTFMGERGTQKTDDQEEFERRFWAMVDDIVDTAEAKGRVASAPAVYAQGEMTEALRNPDIYVGDVADAMEARTGFRTIDVFRVGSAQNHTGASNSEAGIQAVEAMEYLAPILLAPTLCAPLPPEGVAGNLAYERLTDQQREHLRRVGLTQADFEVPYLSGRTALRVAGSPSGGIWREPAPAGMDGYLERGDRQLRAKQINNIDRTNGWHTDRYRIVLDGSGANTAELCFYDPALGNPGTLVPLKLLASALFTRFEAMAMKGKDPREAVARLLGTASLSRQERLDAARAMLLEVARNGNDATTYRYRRPGGWLPELLRQADKSPFTRLSRPQKYRLGRMYATWAETEEAMKEWCRQKGVDHPTAEAYFDLGVGVPAQYMLAHYEHLRQASPKASRAELIRAVELGAGQALHAASKRRREQA